MPLDRPTLEEDPEVLPVERLPELRTVPLELLPLLLEDLTVRPVDREFPKVLYMLVERVDEDGVLSQPERAFFEAERVCMAFEDALLPVPLVNAELLELLSP